ncbi:MAG: hypothetical protein AAF478_02330 [Pseudomonadota bacterium]
MNVRSAGTGVDVTGSGTFNAAAGTGFRLATTSGAINSTAAGGVLFDPFTSAVTLSSITANGGTNGILLDTIDGTFSVTGAVNVTNSNADGIKFANNAANVNFAGATTITNPGDSVNTAGISGIDISGTNTGTITFANLDIALQADNKTAFDLSSAISNANISATDFDVTSLSATGTTGVDLAGTTGTGIVTLGEANIAAGEDATIAGVNSGVNFSGTTNLNFTFGDGDGTGGANDGTASSINATTPITGTLPTNGTYDFEDVAFTGDTSALSGPTVFFVDQAQTGANDGSSVANAGSIANAEASSADVIVLVDTNLDGLQDNITTGADILDLDDGQALISFASGDTAIDVSTLGVAAGGAPASFMFTGLGGGSTIINTPAGIDTVRPILSSNGITVRPNGSAGIANAFLTSANSVGINHTTGTSGDLVIRDVTVSAPNSIGLNVAPGSGTHTVDIDGITATGDSGGGAFDTGIRFATANVTVTRLEDVTILGGTHGLLVETGVTFDADTGTAGIQQVSGGTFTYGTNVARLTGSAIEMDNVTGSLQFDNVSIFNQNAPGIDLVNAGGTEGLFTFGNTNGTINTQNGSAIEATDVVLNSTFGSITSTSSAGDGILLRTSTGSSFTVTGATNVTSSASDGIDITNSAGTFTFGAVTVDNSGSGGSGIRLQNSNSATTNFNGLVDIDTANGAGFNYSNGGTVTQAAAINIDTTSGTGFSTINSGGRTVTLNNAANTVATATGEIINISTSNTNATFATASASALNGSKGIDVTSHTGTLTVNGGTITNSGTGESIEIHNSGAGSTITIDADINFSGTGRAVEVNGGSGTVNIGSNINTTGATGLAVDIQSRTSGTITFSGNFTDNNATGGGFSFQNNTGGATDFTGTTTTINTATATGLSITNSANHTITFSGANTDIDTTSGTAVAVSNGGTVNFNSATTNTINSTTGRTFLANGGGTVVIGGTANLQSSTGTTVEINGSTIGATGVTFESVSANGAANGIVLNNTGTTGGFTVTGDGNTSLGGNGSGGTIQNTTGSGILLTSVSDVSLSNMTVSGSGTHGLQGTTVANLTVSHSTFSNNGNAANENSIDLTNLFGTSLIDDVDFNGINSDGIEVINNTIDDGVRDVLTVRDSTFSNHSAPNGQHGIHAESETNANMGLVVEGSTFNINANGNQGIFTVSDNNSSFNVTVQNTTFNPTGTFINPGTIAINNVGASTGTNLITGNTINNAPGIGITVSNQDTATSSTTISNNATIDGSGAGVNNSDAITIVQNGNGAMTVLISGNTISDFGGNQINAAANNGNGTLNLTITNNSATNAPSNFISGAEIVSQNSNTVCANIQGNNFIGNDGGFPGFGPDISIQETNTSTMNVVQSSTANITAVNNGDSVGVVGSPSFSAGVCPVP